MKFHTINGWTKETMKAAIRAGNNGKKSVNHLGSCRYLSPDGNRCAVGCFLPGEHPGQSYKGTAGDLLNEYPDLKKKMPLSPEALRRLQRVHDTYLGNRDMRDVLCEWIDENVEDESRDDRIMAIMAEMSRAGLPNSFVLDAGNLARQDNSILGLMELWADESDKEERAKIVADLQDHIDDDRELPRDGSK